MALLAFDDVTLISRTRRREVALLSEVSFELEAGEWLAVYCPEPASRQALTRVATGIFRPERGIVRLDGQPLPRRRTRSISRQLTLCDAQLLGPRSWHDILPDNGAPRGGRRQVDALLEPLGVPECPVINEPEPLERARASLAGALELRPRAMIVEGPVRRPPFWETDHVCALVRAIADRGIAVLMTTDDAHGIAGADRAVTMSYGEMRGELKASAHAPVVSLPSTEH